jgi:hypothetical protein
MNYNIQGSNNALNIARLEKTSLFIPSTIQAFSVDLRKNRILDDDYQNPKTPEGMSKVK